MKRGRKPQANNGARTARPTKLGECIPGDQVVLDGKHVVVIGTRLASSGWVRDMVDGAMGELRSADLDAPIEIVELR